MISSFEKNRLTEVLKDFYTVVGIRISVFDDKFNIVTEYPSELPEICKLIRSTEAGAKACRTCDNEACKRAKKLRQPHVYTCHAGITEAITPIRLGGGVVGYAIFAHMMPSEDYETAVTEVCHRTAQYALDGDEVLKAVKKVKKHSREKILSSVKLLDAIAAYLQISNLASWKNDDISRQIDLFIENNLKERLDSDTICRQFFVSRTKLYQISMDSFGMGIGQYVTFKRIEKAKNLFKEKAGNTTVTAVARAVGVDDHNYFCKLFRKSVGVSPGKYMADLLKKK
ncbi:MAG: PocR ligand-binding domain-containing protein [Clostridia bacterium]|nr:PocR ligand-binding domain-containing protein [Clostridia bacterium]